MRSRQEILDQIRETSRDEFILDEMIRRGFWPKEGELPEDPADEIRQREELRRKLHSLTTEDRKLSDVEKLKREARRQRLAESRLKRQETKERRLRERAEKAEAWREQYTRDIVYLGSDVSGGLNQQKIEIEELQKRGLPELHSVEELAEAMETTVAELRFLAFDRRTSTTTHYQRFAIPKKTGGIRNISAPMPRLKRAQEWILWNILDKIELHPAAHGFRTGRSIVTNAEPHVKAEVVINVDLENFFPTVTWRRVRGLFRKFGYSEQLATVLALICSEPEVTEVQLDQKTYYVQQSERRLPQGAPSSPAITNILCRGLDARLTGLAEKLGFTYTRYADDLTFSHAGQGSAAVGRMLRQVSYVVEQEGFQLHPEKTRIFRKGSRQEVTGLVVNERVNIPRKKLRQFRATLYQIEKDGPEGKHWGNSPNVLEAIEGYANFVAMVDPEKGREFQLQVRTIIEKEGRTQRNDVQRDRWNPNLASEEISEIPATGAVPPSVSSLLTTQEIEPVAPAAGEVFESKSKPWWMFWARWFN
ncbi:Reverse transcriptase (RNA-dependent DNA polymerase) [Polystyrenella longa]|uniref:RNA-directed DNA polymerase n=1 Tax=Polystyrenella longa TaxID=2528007 RepID=A0A518CSZ8_9PLAN|nr:reverse transcriptase family protein [Polystyrenella longa]QDU82304.1 Reverse transcriptase (RNA-dependent DNA polymerase) [Polystyrenella longa]